MMIAGKSSFLYRGVHLQKTVFLFSFLVFGEKKSSHMAIQVLPKVVHLP